MGVVHHILRSAYAESYLFFENLVFLDFDATCMVPLTSLVQCDYYRGDAFLVFSIK